MWKYLIIVFFFTVFLPVYAFAAGRQTWIPQKGYYASNLNYVFTDKRKITILKSPVLKVAPAEYAALKTGASVVSALDAFRNKLAAGKSIKKTEQIKKAGVYTISGFRFDSSRINRYMIPEMNDVKYMLKSGRIKIISITGYTDSIGSKRYNDVLALKRAKAAERYLNVKVELNGFGKCCYVSKSGKLNRRVKIIFKRDKR